VQSESRLLEPLLEPARLLGVLVHTHEVKGKVVLLGCKCDVTQRLAIVGFGIARERYLIADHPPSSSPLHTHPGGGAISLPEQRQPPAAGRKEARSGISAPSQRCYWSCQPF